MKTLTTIIILILFNSVIFSQSAIMKGNYSLSGSISYSYSKNTIKNQLSDSEFKVDNFMFSPDFSFFITDNLLLGGKISFNYNELNSKSTYRNALENPIIIENKRIRRHLAIGPNVRYYFNTSSFFPFVEIAYNYSDELASDQKGHIFNFTGGINFFISQNIALEPFIGYSFGIYKNPDEDINTLSVGIRVNYFVLIDR